MFTIGFSFGLGLICAVVLFFFLAQCVGKLLPYGKDDTDSAMGRSGLRLYTDAKTGVQYVGNGSGITVRVDAEGNPVVTRTNR